MALTPRLDLRHTQSLVMTPQLQQAIKLLQLSNIELTAFVEQELERNPLLERDEGGDDLGADDRREERVEANADRILDPVAGTEGETPLDIDYDNTFASDSASDLATDGETFGLSSDWSGKGGRSDFADDEGGLERTLSEGLSLRDHLAAQAGVDLTGPADRLIGAHLIDMLDAAGYVTGDLAEVAAALGTSPERVEAVLLRLQHFDPPGIFARTLKECLALQLRDRDRLDPAMQALLDHLPMLAKRDFNSLMQVCGVDGEDLTEMIAEIRALNPKPATAFDHGVAPPVTPDVLMRAASDGGWIIELNADTLPRLLVDHHYHARVARGARNRDDKAYIAENLQSANWLVKSLNQRAATILKVATELVRQQEAFFFKGVEYLRPLVLRDIALAIEMHESTVSRVTSNKYMATPRGIFELKYFFTQAIGSADGGEAHSAESVRYRIKTLIDAERPEEILSDETIVEVLKQEGIEIARRTVAKYRETLRIPSSLQRRREKSTPLHGA